MTYQNRLKGQIDTTGLAFVTATILYWVIIVAAGAITPYTFALGIGTIVLSVIMGGKVIFYYNLNGKLVTSKLIRDRDIRGIPKEASTLGEKIKDLEPGDEVIFRVWGHYTDHEVKTNWANISNGIYYIRADKLSNHKLLDKIAKVSGYGGDYVYYGFEEDKFFKYLRVIDISKEDKQHLTSIKHIHNTYERHIQQKKELDQYFKQTLEDLNDE